MKYKLSKKIVHKLIDKEAKIMDIKPKIIISDTKIANILYIINDEIENKLFDNQMTIADFFSNIIKNIKSSQIQLAEYDILKNSIKILIKNLKKDSENKEDYLWKLIMTTYHEYKHAIINTENIESREFYDNFNLSICALMINISNYYQEYHDEFYEEIQADKYAVEKAINFLKKYPKTYQKVYPYSEKERLNIEIRSNNYDVQHFFNKLTKKIKNKFDKTTLFQETYPYTIIPILYNEAGTLKDIKTLSQTIYWNNKIPLEVKYLIVSSKAYLDSLNYNDLTTEELKFLLEALEYTYNLEQNRRLTNEKLKQEINAFKNLSFDLLELDLDNEILLLTLEEKELQNNMKIYYLKRQIEKVTILLQKNKNYKKLTKK